MSIDYRFGVGETFSTIAAAKAAIVAAESSPLGQVVNWIGKGTFQEGYNTNGIKPTAVNRLKMGAITGETLIIDGNSVLGIGISVEELLAAGGTGGFVDIEDITIRECTQNCVQFRGNNAANNPHNDVNIRRSTLKFNPTVVSGGDRGALRIAGNMNDLTITGSTVTCEKTGEFLETWAAGNRSNNILWIDSTIRGPGRGGSLFGGSQSDPNVQYRNCFLTSTVAGSGYQTDGFQSYIFCTWLLFRDDSLLRMTGGGTGYVLKNNIFHMQIGVGVGTWVDKASDAAFFESDFNCLFVKTGGSGKFAKFDGAFQNTLALWQAASGQDANSIILDPKLTDITEGSEDFHLQSDSPCLAAGVTIAGITTDFEGDTRNDPNPDIGADEIFLPPAVSTAGMDIRIDEEFVDPEVVADIPDQAVITEEFIDPVIGVVE